MKIDLPKFVTLNIQVHSTNTPTDVNQLFRKQSFVFDLYNRYEEAYGNFKNVQRELKNIYYKLYPDN